MRVRLRKIAVVVLLAATAALGAPGHAQETSPQLDRLQERLNEARAKVRSVQSRADTVQEQIATIDEQAAAVAEALRAAEELVRSTQADIRVLEAEVQQKQRSYRRTARRAQQIAVEMYKGGASAQLEILLDSTDVDELMSRMQYVGESSRNNSRVMVTTKRLQLELLAAKAQLEEKLQIAIEAREERRAQAQHLRELRSAKKQRLDALRQRITEQRDEIASIHKRSEELEQQLAAQAARQEAARQRAAERARQRAAERARRAAESRAAQAATPAPATASSAPAASPRSTPAPTSRRTRSGSGFIWPLNGRVTSGYGYRWGRMHNGIDIDGVTGDAIRASRAGNVFQVSYDGGYGNHVVLVHGGGFATLYAHASAVYVRPGQSVAQGQTIAAVGCTGSCTGDHLHFEIRVNGTPRDPMQYLP